MRAGRSAVVVLGIPAAGGTRWKGRLRSHHETPQSAPTQRLPSRVKNQEETEEVQTSKKRATLQKKGRGRNAGAACSPGAPQRRSPRLSGSHHETPQSVPLQRLPSRVKNQEETEEVQTSKKPATFQKKGRGRNAGAACSPGAPQRRSPRLSGSHHETPQSVPPQRLPSRVKNQEETEKVQTSKKRSALQEKGRERNAGAARSPAAPQRRSPRLSGSDPEHPIVIDDVSEVCKGKDNQWASKSLRRSPRFHPENKDSCKQVLPPCPGEITRSRKTEKTLRKYKSQDSLKRNNINAGIKSQKEPQEPFRGPQDIPLRNKVADLSHKKSVKQDLKPNHCEVLTRKRKRGTRGASSPRRQICDPKSLPPDCQEIAPGKKPRKSFDRKIENDSPIICHPKTCDERLTNVDEINKVTSEVEREGREHCCGSDDWTEEQEMALRNAYFTARPSPRFWKRVSKMVPGRSAEECFYRIHADLSTPTPIAARPRKSKTFSPVGKFTLSEAKLPNLMEPTVVRQRTKKQKSLAAQKTVRHLLRKQCLSDQAQVADHFSLFETSPSAIQLNITLEDAPGTPDSYLNSGSLNKCSGSFSARKKPLSRLRTKQAEPSPAVLKPIKNLVLHERYINQLARREYTKKPRRNLGSKAADSENFLSEKGTNVLKAAKNALISEATDFIGRFKKLQANSHARIVENSEDDESDCIECNSSDD